MPQYNTTGNLRFLDRTHTEQERLNFYSFYQEQIQLYGQYTTYYTYNYKISAEDAIYGEQTTAGYLSGVKMLMFVELEESSLLLGKYGLQSDDEVTAFVMISFHLILIACRAVQITKKLIIRI